MVKYDTFVSKRGVVREKREELGGISAYLSFLLDLTQERREKKIYLLVGDESPRLACIHIQMSKWEGGENVVRLECRVTEIDGVAVPKEEQKTILFETIGAPTAQEQNSILKEALLRHELQGRAVQADDVEGHLRIAALRRRLFERRSRPCSL